MMCLRCCCLFLLVIVVVSTNATVPPITLLGNGSQLHCVIANDTSNSAITFVGDGFIQEPEHDLPVNICRPQTNDSPFQCVAQGKHYIGYLGHVFDRRWDDFETLTTSKDTYTFSKSIGIPGNGVSNFDIGFSVRVKGDGHILLCDGPQPQNSKCYWFILEGFRNGIMKTFMRRCEQDIPIVKDVFPEECNEPVADNSISGLTSLSEWSHFLIRMRSRVISLFKIGDKKAILRYEDYNPIHTGYLFFRSPKFEGLWKVHWYNFMEFYGGTIIRSTNLHIPTSSSSVCVAVYLKLCANCRADVTLLDDSLGILDTNTIEGVVQGEDWTEIQLKTQQSPSSSKFIVKITPRGAYQKYWYLGEILECVPDGVRKISAAVPKSKDICCYVVKSGEKICKVEEMDSKTTTVAKQSYDCPANSIGSRCFPCNLFGTCDYYKYCEYSSDKQIECHCARGFISNDCSTHCGDLCSQICNRCSKGCSQDDRRCQQCKKNFLGDFCESFDLPVLKDKPEIVNISHTSVTIKINPEYDGKRSPSYFQVQLKTKFLHWTDIKEVPFANVSQLVTITGLLSNTYYNVRILLKTRNGEAYEEDQFIPITNFTTSCQELSPETIKAKVDGHHVSFSIFTSPERCNIDLYSMGDNNLPISQASFQMQACTPYTYKIINKATNESFNISFRTGDKREVVQCPVVHPTQTSALLQWDYHGKGSLKYNISYQKLGNNCSHSYQSEFIKVAMIENTNITINNLEPYNYYTVSINPENGTSRNIKVHTDASDQLNEESVELTYRQDHNTLTVTANIADCSKLTGPIDFSLEVRCESAWCKMEDTHVYNASKFIGMTEQFAVPGLTDYTLSSVIRRNNSVKKNVLRITTNETAPGPVRNAVIYSKTDNSVSFRWMPPYPPMGELSYYHIEYYSKTRHRVHPATPQTKDCNILKCPLYEGYHCCDIKKLSFGEDYIFEICAINNKHPCRQTLIVNGRPGFQKPMPPAGLELKWDKYNNLTVEFKHPNITNGPLTGYAIYVNGDEYLVPIETEQPLYTYGPIMIEPAIPVHVEVYVTNKVGYAEVIQQDTISPPPNPTVPTVSNIETTNFTISIPTFKFPDEVMCSLLVIVKAPLSTESTGQMSDEDKSIFKQYNIDFDEHITWIAVDSFLEATSTDKWTIVIGTGDFANSIHLKTDVHNRMLASDTPYEVIIFITTTFLTESRNGTHQYSVKTKYSEEGNNYSLYLLALIILPVICVIVFVILRRRGIKITTPFPNRNTETSSSNGTVAFSAVPPVQRQQPKLLKQKPPIYQNTAEALEEDCQFSRVVKVTELEQYVKKSLENNQFAKQHALFPRGQTKPWLCGMKPENKPKNRYNNLAAYDHTRVKLELCNGEANSDYINANYIDGYNHPKAFIATQGPKESTLNDFWRMIWQENVEHIVMIANLVENDKKKVAKYWPGINETMQFDDILVKYIRSDIFADYEERDFLVTRNGHTSRRIKQLHFVSWPDHGVPMYPQSIAIFHKRALAIKLSNKPIVVHCSAGVGRTGTFILCDTCLRMAAREGQVDILQHQYKLREQRPNMVDNVAQYKLAHMVLLQCLISPDTSILCTEDMMQHVETLLASKEIQKQMKYLDDSAWMDDAVETHNADHSTVTRPEKNRIRYVLPDEYYKVILSPYPVHDDSSTYINAVRVVGFRGLSKYIITQYPLKDTVGDFWRMVHQQNVSVVICLNTIDTSDRTLGQFYPTEECPEITPVPFLKVQLVSVENNTHIDTLTCDLVETEEGNLTSSVILLQMKGWKYENMTPDSIEGILDFYEEMTRIGKRSDEIIICCYDGVRACGLLSAMSFIIEKIKLEQLCDVCLAVRNVRHSRKEFLRDADQYKYLYRCALEYVRKFELYSNFRS